MKTKEIFIIKIELIDPLKMDLFFLILCCFLNVFKFYFMCSSVWLVCIYMHHLCSQYPTGISYQISSVFYLFTGKKKGEKRRKKSEDRGRLAILNISASMLRIGDKVHHSAPSSCTLACLLAASPSPLLPTFLLPSLTLLNLNFTLCV